MEHLGQARTFVTRLEARGGTEMVPAMRAALVDQGGANSEATAGRLSHRMVRSAMSSELFETITAGLGRSRIFMVGIGSAPNTYLMNHAAELGRGSVIHIGSVEQVEERMRGLFSKLERPAVTDLRSSSPRAAWTSLRRCCPIFMPARRCRLRPS